MTTTEHARRYLRQAGCRLTAEGDTYDGWAVVSSEYSWAKHSTVYFHVVTADPDGDLWSYTAAIDYDDGAEIITDPLPMVAVVETKKVITYRPKLIPRDPQGPEQR